MLCVVAPVASQAGTLPASFTLGKYVPGDWWMYMHYVHNPERQWVEEQWAKVWDALVKSGIDKDILSLVSGVAGDKGQDGIGDAVDTAKELLGRVRWGDLCKSEFVLAERIGAPFPEYLMLTRGAASTGEANAKGLASIMAHFASMSDAVQVTPSTDRGVSIWTLRGPDAVPYALHLFRKNDVVGLFVGGATLDPIVDLMTGGGASKAIVDTPRFQTALKQVVVPEDGVMFFDYRALFQGIESLMDMAVKESGDGNGPGKDSPAIVKAVGKALDMLNVADYGVISMETRGHRQFTHAVTKLQENKVTSPIAKLFLDRKPFDPFDKYIPADATGFHMDGFVDLGLLYHTVLDFIEKEIPDGTAHLEQWKGIQAGFGFDLDRDLFSWWSGEMINIDLPTGMATPMGGADKVLMIRVKDSKLAAKKIDQALQWVVVQAGKAMGQPLLLTPVPDAPEGFKQVTFQPMAMFLRPVVGVKDDWLMFATSPGALKKCLKVASGQAPSIMKNERFRAEGLVPKGAVHSASFKDTSKFGQELGQALGMASMIGGMMGAGMGGQDANDPDAKKKQQVIQKLFGVLMKLGPVVQKIDFYSSEASISTRDGVYCRNKCVTTYKHQEEKTAGAGPRQ